MSADLTHWCGVFVEFEQAKKYPGDCTKTTLYKKFPADLVIFLKKSLTENFVFCAVGNKIRISRKNLDY